MGIATVLAPAGTATRGDLRVAGAETLREAISAGLEAPAAREAVAETSLASDGFADGRCGSVKAM